MKELPLPNSQVVSSQALILDLLHSRVSISNYTGSMAIQMAMFVYLSIGQSVFFFNHFGPD